MRHLPSTRYLRWWSVAVTVIPAADLVNNRSPLILRMGGDRVVGDGHCGDDDDGEEVAQKCLNYIFLL
jgi:hypothetical protein